MAQSLKDWLEKYASVDTARQLRKQANGLVDTTPKPTPVAPTTEPQPATATNTVKHVKPQARTSFISRGGSKMMPIPYREQSRTRAIGT